jgi:hypothetical protein
VTIGRWWNAVARDESDVAGPDGVTGTTVGGSGSPYHAA